MDAPKYPSPGPAISGGTQARQGYALNKMCVSFNEAANRAEFLRDEDAYCARYGLTARQRDAVRRRSIPDLLAAGGNPCYRAKRTGIFGLDGQVTGARQAGAESPAMLVPAVR